MKAFVIESPSFTLPSIPSCAYILQSTHLSVLRYLPAILFVISISFGYLSDDVGSPCIILTVLAISEIVGPYPYRSSDGNFEKKGLEGGVPKASFYGRAGVYRLHEDETEKVAQESNWRLPFTGRSMKSCTKRDAVMG